MLMNRTCQYAMANSHLKSLWQVCVPTLIVYKQSLVSYKITHKNALSVLLEQELRHWEMEGTQKYAKSLHNLRQFVHQS